MQEKCAAVVSLIFALFAGVGTRSQWNNWVLLVHASKFPTSDQQFHKNIGFSTSSSCRSSNFVLQLAFVSPHHHLDRHDHLPLPERRDPASVSHRAGDATGQSHVSVLLGALALVKAVGYWFDRYGLVLSTKHVCRWRHLYRCPRILAGQESADPHRRGRGRVVHHQHPPEGLDPADHRRRLVGAVWILVGGVYPAFIQAVQVDPSENFKERPYITRNITATRYAFGLDKVADKNFQGSSELTASDVAPGTATIRACRTSGCSIRTSYVTLQPAAGDPHLLPVQRSRCRPLSAVEPGSPTLTAIRELNSPTSGGFVNNTCNTPWLWRGAVRRQRPRVNPVAAPELPAQ